MIPTAVINFGYYSAAVRADTASPNTVGDIANNKRVSPSAKLHHSNLTVSPVAFKPNAVGHRTVERIILSQHSVVPGGWTGINLHSFGRCAPERVRLASGNRRHTWTPSRDFVPNRIVNFFVSQNSVDGAGLHQIAAALNSWLVCVALGKRLATHTQRRATSSVSHRYVARGVGNRGGARTVASESSTAARRKREKRREA